MIILAVVISALFLTENADFFDQAAKEREQGYTWHYTGKQALDPRSKALPLQCVDKDGKPCGKPFILWKLKK
jgi:hypothetical protein